MYKLGELVSIQMGHSFRTGLSQWVKGNVPVVQMKDISDSGLIQISSMNRVGMEGLKENHLLQPGDLIFRSRGSKTISAVVPELGEKLMLSAPLFRLRMIQPGVLPGYLSWYINQPDAQTHLEKMAKGSAQMMISKQDLVEMLVEIPSLKTQEKIVEMVGLLNREAALVETIVEKRKEIISAQLARMIQED